jgi:hypothetical protein
MLCAKRMKRRTWEESRNIFFQTDEHAGNVDDFLVDGPVFSSCELEKCSAAAKIGRAKDKLSFRARQMVRSGQPTT